MRSPRPRLGPFELLSAIGRGASGEVWRGWHRESGVGLAIKLLHGQQAAGGLRRMQQELRAVARMDHPGIVRVHDHGQLDAATADTLGMAPGTAYFVMDFAGARTLRYALGRRAWPALRGDLLALLDALAHAHARGVVHRDLKPDNVLMGPDGPILTDFGVALALETSAVEDGSTGTPNYMAPEQVRGDVRALGPWTDLYAVGCLAHALATGAAPFAGKGSVGALRGHLEEPAPRLQPPWPPAFAAWVDRLLCKAPAERFVLAADAAHALAAIPADLEDAQAAPSALASRPAFPLPDWRRPPPARPVRLAGVHRALADLRQIDPVGRTAEQTGLWGALARAVRRRRLEVAVVESITGNGGTHLARWLARRAHELGVADSLLARHAASSPEGGLTDMVSRALRLDDLDGPEAVEQAARALGLEPDDRAAVVAAATGSRLRRASHGETAVALRSRAEFLVALAGTVGRMAAIMPRVVILDDAQWGPEAVEFAERLLDAHADLPVLVVVTVLRDRIERPMTARIQRLAERATTYRLGALPDDAIGEVVRRLAPAGPALVQAVVERAHGDPGRAAALLRLWSARGHLVQDEDGLRPASREPPTPAVDADLWLQRVEQVAGPLTDDLWAALELLATWDARVSGARWSTLATHAALPDPDALAGALAPLTDAGLLVDEPEGWGLEHGRLRAAVLRRADEGGRTARWHRACAATLAADDDPEPERLARHRAAAGDAAAAVDPFVAAAVEARRRTDVDGVRRNLLGAAQALRASGTGRGDPRWADLHARWALADLSRGRIGRARRRARHADRIARGPAHQALAAYALGEATSAAEPQHADLHLRRAEARAREVGDVRLAVRCAEARGWVLYHRGRYDRVEQLIARAFERFDAAASPLLAANLLFLRAIAARARQSPEAYAHLARAAVLYGREGARHGQASVRNEMGEVALATGDHRTALGHYLQARSIFDELGSRSVIVADLNLGRVHDALGDVRQGEAHRREALRLAERHGDGVMTAFAAVCLLTDAARGQRFDLWPTRFAQLGPLLDGAVMALEAAEAARAAAELAARAGAHREARQAYGLAALQYDGVGRAAEAEAARAAAEASTGEG